ncbi:MAG: SAM-dependent chlorinase/fluorinase [Leptolyngbya sp. SIO4C1]|nr:SAM-dependent chlorinase/fluorinase [Leptolyngbya sp. SIO4C1]
MATITLLTDFGTQDAYVGSMKGVIAQINPSALMVDLTHQIAPQDILAARFVWLHSYPYFPVGTVHLAVVDPGVGTQRRAIAAEFDRGFLVGPDNGLLASALAQVGDYEAVELTNPDYWLTPHPSQTFHGRDIFAPAAAHLSRGVALQALGKPAVSLAPLELPACQPIENGIEGSIQYVDRFGNLITNIPAAQVSERAWTITCHQQTVTSQATYGAVAYGHLLSLIGSHGWVEIAVNGGSAARALEAAVRDTVRLFFHRESDRAVP